MVVFVDKLLGGEAVLLALFALAVVVAVAATLGLRALAATRPDVPKPPGPATRPGLAAYPEPVRQAETATHLETATPPGPATRFETEWQSDNARRLEAALGLGTGTQLENAAQPGAAAQLETATPPRVPRAPDFQLHRPWTITVPVVLIALEFGAVSCQTLYVVAKGYGDMLAFFLSLLPMLLAYGLFEGRRWAWWLTMTRNVVGGIWLLAGTLNLTGCPVGAQGPEGGCPNGGAPGILVALVLVLSWAGIIVPIALLSTRSARDWCV